MEIKRVLGPLLAVVLLLGIGAATYTSYQKNHAVEAAKLASAAILDIKGMVGSEKESYFSDPRVIEILAKKGFRVKVEKVGSTEIISRDFSSYDFAFPAGAPAALALQNKARAKQVYPTFFTPMTIASWGQLIPTLESEGIVKKVNDAYFIIDMKKLLSLSEKGTRWRELKDNAAYATGKSILISSTDVRKSNSAAMYLSLASYVVNDNNVVDNNEQVNRILPFVSSLFLRQGLQESSSAGPFEDYTTMGMGKAPLVMIYESQFLEYQSKRPKPNADMVLLYPQPTIYTKHILVPFNENGRRLGEFLANDVELQKLAAEYGYRTASTEHFGEFLKRKNLLAPTSLVDVIDPPSFEILERMIQAIEKKFQ
ncbi:hypothetical protein [Undibacterium sp.]|uniref:hypothetical protein n=1 Tax=Undibacterium sp. TaxID=1914977 RepID=UPI00272FA21A|nr:hypothetical protein [Undibacterium sp.]MDP1976459.1 hypothetical protein [Undibacterium sp.]